MEQLIFDTSVNTLRLCCYCKRPARDCAICRCFCNTGKDFSAYDFKVPSFQRAASTEQATPTGAKGSSLLLTGLAERKNAAFG